MTICFECMYHTNTGPRVKTSDMQDYQKCSCPAVRLKEARDPVTGRLMFKDGGVYVEDPTPYCRDINKGDCPHFREITGTID